MEVHAHSHTPRNKWTHYFWEFLMLFLAVFCGFLAEYQLEHKIEKDREKVYLQNLLADVKADTASFAEFITTTKIVLQKLDSIMLLTENENEEKNTDNIYFLARTFTIRNERLITNEKTYEEMKSAGVLRLIHNRPVANAVSEYYNFLKITNNQNDNLSDRITRYMALVHKLFNAKTFFKIFKEQKKPSGARFMNHEADVLNEFLMATQYLYGTLNLQLKWATQRNKQALQLIEIIQNKYNLK